jgi:hypothetical protein
LDVREKITEGWKKLCKEEVHNGEVGGKMACIFTIRN